MRLSLLLKKREKNDFGRVEVGTLIRVGSWNNGKRKGKIYLMNKKENEECGMEYEKGSM